MEQRQVTTGREWRQGYVRTLPSGKTVRLRKPSLLGLTSHGQAPDLLTGIIIAGIQGKPTNSVAMEDITPETLESFVKALNTICQGCFLEPRIVERAQAEDEIEVGDIEDNDKMAVLMWALGKEGALGSSFLAGSTAGAGTAPGSGSVPAATQPDPGPAERLDSLAV